MRFFDIAAKTHKNKKKPRIYWIFSNKYGA